MGGASPHLAKLCIPKQELDLICKPPRATPDQSYRAASNGAPFSHLTRDPPCRRMRSTPVYHAPPEKQPTNRRESCLLRSFHGRANTLSSLSSLKIASG